MTWDSVKKILWTGEVNEETCEWNVQDSDEISLEIVDDIVQ